MKNSGNKVYKIVYSKNAQEDLPEIAKSIQKTIRNAINERLTKDPIVFGKPLSHNLKSYKSLRVGNYRVIYNISKEKKMVFIIAIKHRSYVYEEIN